MEKNVLLFNKSRVKILLNLRNSGRLKNCLKKSKEVNITYAFYMERINDLKRLGILELKKNGKINEILLTEKGKAIADNLNEISNLLQDG